MLISKLLIFVLAMVSVPLACHHQSSSPGPGLGGARQLVVVTSPGPESTQGSLRRYQAEADGRWQPVGEAVNARLGRSGLAWGMGLHDPEPGLQKKEGDGKSPAGIFRLTGAFGYAAPGSLALRLPYVQATAQLECVDDSGSAFYNQLVDREAVVKDWNSSEQMLREDAQYKWGLYVEHNRPAQPQGGSCIFLHIWRSPDSPTSGCTSMAEADLLSLLQWLDPAQKPCLVQLTLADYGLLKRKYALP